MISREMKIAAKIISPLLFLLPKIFIVIIPQSTDTANIANVTAMLYRETSSIKSCSPKQGLLNKQTELKRPFLSPHENQPTNMNLDKR